jgi:Ca2+-binding RTX toxin-like protein
MFPLTHTPSTTPGTAPADPAHTAGPRDTRRRSRRRAAAGILSAGALIGATLCAGAVPASAATTVSVRDGVLRVISQAGTENNISVTLQTVSAEQKYYRVLDSGDTLTAGPGCTQDGAAVRCLITAALTSIRVETKDRKDTITAGVEVFTPMEVHAGSGDDTIRGGSGDDTIHGNGGSDTIYGGEGSDTIGGGGGHDHLDGDLGRDTLSGGAGKDLLEGDRGHDILSGGAGNDQLKGDAGGGFIKVGGRDTLLGGTGDDELSGGRGSDRLVGGAGDDELSGSRGNDDLEGNAGDDTLVGGKDGDEFDGGAGKDRLDAQDGSAETVDGGSDEDTCTVDTIDTTVNCEA